MKYIWAILAFFCLSPQTHAQGEMIEHGNLEEWTLDTLYNYEEPAGPWTTANRIAALAPSAPITTFKETEKVYAGNYAAKMVTDEFDLFAGLPVTGNLSLGTFDPNDSNPISSLKLGVPFTDKPTHFKGYYMYTPVNGDSCAIYLQLTKYNQTAQKKDTLAEAWLQVGDVVDEYTHFNLPIEYFSEETPDSITIVCVPSVYGHLFIAEKGSTLYIDELSIDYTTGVNVPMFPELQVKTYPNPVSDILHLTSSESLRNASFKLFDLAGREQFVQTLGTGDQFTVSLQQLIPGQYIYQLFDEDVLKYGGKIEILK